MQFYIQHCGLIIFAIFWGWFFLVRYIWNRFADKSELKQDENKFFSPLIKPFSNPSIDPAMAHNLVRGHGPVVGVYLP